MGGPGASDDMKQVWLAAGNDPQAKATGRYFYHLRPLAAKRQANDKALQDRLLEICAELSGIILPA